MLIEEFSGHFPLWIAPRQVAVLPVNNEYHLEYAKAIYEEIRKKGYRVEIDDRNEKLSYKMREGQLKKIPITVILGQKEVDNKEISFRLFGSQDTTTLSIDEFYNYIKDLIENKK